MHRPRSLLAPRCAALPFAVLVVGACAGAQPTQPPPPLPVPSSAPSSSAVAPIAAPPLSPAQIAARATPAVVSLRSPHRLGTGFVVRKDGWIATNLHVIAGARELIVVTTDNHEYPVADVLASDEVADLALVRVEASDLRPVVLGDSEQVRPGDSVVAIGHPLGLEDTVSNGLVSAVRADAGLTVLQISAPIAPGSSGGPLFSDKGEVIGVATSFINAGQNLNFGVPVRYLKLLIDAPHPVPFTAFAAATTPEPHPLPAVKRDVPHHEVAFLAGCSEQDLERAAHIVGEAIQVGAPVYNERHFAACYHIYEGAALDVEKRLPATCLGPKRAMRDGRTKAAKLDDPSAQAWAMRDAFDGLMEVIVRRLGGGRP